MFSRSLASLRERYGMHLFGQSCLAARRLLEAGGKFVTVCWDEYGLVNTGWDTHIHLQSRLREELGPGFDQAFSTLVEILRTGGCSMRLQSWSSASTAELRWCRTSRAERRDHWSRLIRVLAGGPFARGRVVGRTDHLAGDVTDGPALPRICSRLCTTCWGSILARKSATVSGVPYPIGGDGRTLGELLE